MLSKAVENVLCSDNINLRERKALVKPCKGIGFDDDDDEEKEEEELIRHNGFGGRRRRRSFFYSVDLKGVDEGIVSIRM